MGFTSVQEAREPDWHVQYVYLEGLRIEKKESYLIEQIR